MNRPRLVFAALILGFALPAAVQGQAGRRGDVLDANTASDKQLLAVPGLTPAVAKAIKIGRVRTLFTSEGCSLGRMIAMGRKLPLP